MDQGDITEAVETIYSQEILGRQLMESTIMAEQRNHPAIPSTLMITGERTVQTDRVND